MVQRAKAENNARLQEFAARAETEIRRQADR